MMLPKRTKVIREYILAFLITLSVTPSTAVAEPTREVEYFKLASTAVFELIATLQNNISSFYKRAKLRQIRRKLQDLHSALYELEKEKTFLLSEIRHDLADEERVVRSAELLNQKIENVRNALYGVGPDLRVEYQDRGRRVEDLLDEAAIERKMWVSKYIGSQNTHEKLDLSAFVSEGEAAVDKLRDASIELSKLLQSLYEQDI
jgi:signal transduction histidine kinase